VAEIRAVLVGVDVYERSDIPPLRGCVNDVVLVRQVLKQYLGVPNENIRLVVNERATKANIVHRLQGMILDAEDGDVLVFYFSGHGSQIRDRDGDELTDALDELICPYDMDWDRKTYILDDDLDAIFAEVGAGVILEAFFDCCFWGPSAREFEPESDRRPLRTDVRYLRPPIDIAARSEGEEQRLDSHQLSACDCFQDRNVFWAASEEGQPAAEDYFEGRVHGVFTYWGCRAIETNLDRILRWGYSREELLEDVRARFRSLGYPQLAELTAPSELRAAEPFSLSPSWEMWVQRDAPQRSMRRERRRRMTQ
jgi:metacaspase-1